MIDSRDRCPVTKTDHILAARQAHRIWRVLDTPLRQAIQILRRLIEQRNGIDAEGHGNLGLAHAALGEHEQALAALRTAYD
jgi:hypothetical protein